MTLAGMTNPEERVMEGERARSAVVSEGPMEAEMEVKAVVWSGVLAETSALGMRRAVLWTGNVIGSKSLCVYLTDPSVLLSLGHIITSTVLTFPCLSGITLLTLPILYSAFFRPG